MTNFIEFNKKFVDKCWKEEAIMGDCLSYKMIGDVELNGFSSIAYDLMVEESAEGRIDKIKILELISRYKTELLRATEIKESNDFFKGQHNVYVRIINDLEKIM